MAFEDSLVCPGGLGPLIYKLSLCETGTVPNDILGFWTCKNLFVSPVGFQMTFWDFGHVKTSLLALAGFQTTFWDFGHVKTSLLAQ